MFFMSFLTKMSAECIFALRTLALNEIVKNPKVKNSILTLSSNNGKLN